MPPGKMRTVAAALVVAALAGLRPAGEERPNILFIMSDDHAAHAIGAYGSRVNQTPHLDRLAREGAIFTSVFATNSILERPARTGQVDLDDEGRAAAIEAGRARR